MRTGARQTGESPLLGNNDLLASGELVLGATESLHHDSLVRVLATDGEDDLSNVDTGDGSVGLQEGKTRKSATDGRQKRRPRQLGAERGQELTFPQAPRIPV